MAITKQSGNVLVSDERIYADADGKVIRGGKDGKIPPLAKTVVVEAGQPLSPAMAAKYGLAVEAAPAPVAPAAAPAGSDTTSSSGTPDKTEPLVGTTKGPVETKPRGKANR